LEEKQATRERLEMPFPFLRDKLAGRFMEYREKVSRGDR
jgi:hypothetical protein